MTWFLTFLALCGWVGIVAWVEHPHTLAWQARNAYRLLCAGLVCLCWLLGTKALLYREELRSLIESCR